MPCRGYPSLSFLRSAANTIAWNLNARLKNWSGQGPIARTDIYYFGDIDV